MSVIDDDLPAWSLRRDDPRARRLAAGLPAEIDRAWAWEGSRGDGVRVAVVDSGIDSGHELVGPVTRAVQVELVAEGQAEVREGGGGDRAGHGTACAGLIRGLAPGCELWDIGVLGPRAGGRSAALIRGVEWAVEQGCRVVNLSLSASKAHAVARLHEVADAAYFAGTVLVASAHNLDIQSYPWRFSSVVSVATHDSADPLEFHYNPEPPVEFFARGMNVEVAWLGGARLVVSGNSFATAQITGICALILAKHPELTPFQLKSVLYATATNTGDPA